MPRQLTSAIRGWSASVGLVLITTALGAQSSHGGRLVSDVLRSSAIEGNVYGDSPMRTFNVYLPPGYATNATARYPVVYLLHDFDETERSWVRGYAGFSIGPAMDSLIAAGAVREMIIVMPNGSNRLGGSFYVNSESSGNWDDFVSAELVAYVDSKYRTIARSGSRGLAGYSMGGFGAFYLGMLHGGDVYGAVYAMSACCTRFATEPDADAAAIWRTLRDVASLADARTLSFYPQIHLALAAAFSPNADKPPLYVDFPFEEKYRHWKSVDAVQERWSEHSPFDMLPHYTGNLKRLRGLMFDVGSRDDLVEPAGLAAMDSVLTRLDVAHVFETYDGDHANRLGVRMITKVLPFFSRTLDFSGTYR